ncbi:hypothetical protein ASG35_18940 [Burkholderia sp. Leaf177]|nr:hypothetical protein ASG35_18940 [Burkholderia sp. Leaf177]
MTNHKYIVPHHALLSRLAAERRKANLLIGQLQYQPLNLDSAIDIESKNRSAHRFEENVRS